MPSIGVNRNETGNHLVREAALADQPDIPVDLIGAKDIITRRVRDMIDLPVPPIPKVDCG